MKKLIVLILGVLLLQSTAEAKWVRFAVDMRGIAINPTGIHVFGGFQTAAGFAGGDWMSGTTLMTKETADTNIYSIVVNIPAFQEYEYKYLNGDQPYDVEFVPMESRVLFNANDNRWFYLDSLANDTTDLGAIRFSQNAPLGHYLIRFRVDMQNETVNASGVHVGGSFQGFSATKNHMYSFDQKVYEHIIFVDSTDLIQTYKFANGNTSGAYETVPGACSVFGNREVAIIGDSMLTIVCFSSCVACVPNGVATINTKQELLYPNPASDVAQLLLAVNKQVQGVELYNSVGSLCKTITGANTTSTVRIEKGALTNGIYLVLVRYADGSVYQQQLIFE